MSTLQEDIARAKKAITGDIPSSMGRLAPVLTEEAQRDINAAKEKMRTFRGYTEGVDYSTGAGMGTRFSVGRMDTPDEVAGWMNKNVGEGQWGRDPGGRVIVSPAGAEKLGIKHKGQPVAINPPGLEMGDVGQFVGAEGPAMGAGMAAGIATGGLGAIPAIAYTGLAGAAGKAIDEGVESAQGYQKQSPGEVAADALVEGAKSAGGEGVVRALRPIARLAFGPYRSPESPLNPFVPARKPGSTFNPIYPTAPVTSRLEPARLEAGKRALEAGFRPSSGQIQGKQAFLWPRIEAASHYLFGDPAEQINRQAALSGRGEMMASVAGQSGARYTARSGEHLGVAVEDRVLNQQKALANAKTSTDEALKRTAQQEVDRVSALAGPQIGQHESGLAVQEAIKQSRREFAGAAAERYSAWAAKHKDVMFPTSNIKQVAQDWLDRFPGKEVVKEGSAASDQFSMVLPPQVESSSWKAAMELSPQGASKLRAILTNLGDEMDAGQMQNLRALLRESAYDPDILPGLPKKVSRDLLKATDETMNASGLGELNAWYKTGISKFDDARILRITRDAGKEGAVDPEEVASYVIRPGKTSLVQKVKGIVGDDTWKTVRRAHWDSMVNDLTGPDGAMSAVALDRRIKDLGMTLDEAYGYGVAKEIRNLSKELLAKEGKIPVEGLQGSSMVDALRTHLSAVRAEEEFLKNNFVSSITSKTYEPSRLAGILMQKDNSRMISQAKEILGETSPEWAKVKVEVAGRLMDGMIDRAGEFGDYLTPSIVNNGLRKAIDKIGYSTVEDILGSAFAGKMAQFSSMLSVALTKQKVGAGAIMTSAIALRPMRNVGKIVELGIVQQISRSPAFIKWMTEGYSAETARMVADNIARLVAHGAPRSKDMIKSALENIETATGIVPGDHK